MQGGGGCTVLTTGLLRVELAPEEYQLYSEGCGWRWEWEVRGWEGDKKTQVRSQSPTSVFCDGETFF